MSLRISVSLTLFAGNAASHFTLSIVTGTCARRTNCALVRYCVFFSSLFCFSLAGNCVFGSPKMSIAIKSSFRRNACYTAVFRLIFCMKLCANWKQCESTIHRNPLTWTHFHCRVAMKFDSTKWCVPQKPIATDLRIATLTTDWNYNKMICVP